MCEARWKEWQGRSYVAPLRTSTQKVLSRPLPACPECTPTPSHLALGLGGVWSNTAAWDHHDTPIHVQTWIWFS